MQVGNLGVARALRRTLTTGARTPVIHQTIDGIVSETVLDCAQRAARLGLALHRFGLAPGARVATFSGTTVEHFEAFLGVPAYGFVLHALNIRMSDQDLARIVIQTQDEVLILDAALYDRFATLAPHLTSSSLKLILVCGASGVRFETLEHLRVDRYQDFFADVETPDAALIPDIDEMKAATICHTGGTTGAPKAVAYSHRSIWIQALNLCLADTLALGRAETALLAVPLYHVNGWGLPYACAISGAGLALPGSSFRPRILLDLIAEGGVTIAAGVPTIWTDLLGFLDGGEDALAPGLRRVATGGAVVPAPLTKALLARGITPLQAWGMTETASMSVIGLAEAATHSPIGRAVPGIELRTVDESGVAQAAGTNASGEVQVRGPTVISHYLGQDDNASDADGWIPTGDIGTIDAAGTLTLTDRLKDAIKSGGEWIPAAALENAICEVDWVAEAAVIAEPHARFQERPFGVLAVKPGHSADLQALRSHLREAVPSWWIPENWALLPTLPRTTLGKPDKRALRNMLADGSLHPISSDETLKLQS